MTSIPSSATILTGGCSCSAVRYTLTIPHWDLRPTHIPSSPSTGRQETKAPYVIFCHCNDCRRASGGFVFTNICCPIEYCGLSLVRRPGSDGHLVDPGDVRDDEDESASVAGFPRVEFSAREVVMSPGVTEGTFYHQYHSSKSAYRSFCERCGTNIAYTAHPMPGGKMQTVDILLPTLDREFLDGEKAEIRPESHYMLDFGIGWVKRLLWEGDGSLFGGTVPRHGTDEREEIA